MQVQVWMEVDAGVNQQSRYPGVHCALEAGRQATSGSSQLIGLG